MSPSDFPPPEPAAPAPEPSDLSDLSDLSDPSDSSDPSDQSDQPAPEVLPAPEHSAAPSPAAASAPVVPAADVPPEAEPPPAPPPVEEPLPEVDPATRRRAIEALLFVADEPLGVRDLVRAVPGLGGAAEVRRILAELAEEYQRTERAFELVELAGGWRLVTRELFHPWLKRFAEERAATRLSAAALETLAVIAYRQPVLRAEIENVRGVGAGPVLRQLLDRRLIRIAGRAEVPGRPLLYGTTRGFLEFFGLKSIEELPKRGEMKGV